MVQITENNYKHIKEYKEQYKYFVIIKDMVLSDIIGNKYYFSNNLSDFITNEFHFTNDISNNMMFNELFETGIDIYLSSKCDNVMIQIMSWYDLIIKYKVI